MKLKDGYTSQNSFLDANQYVNALENDVEFWREKEKSKNERNFIDDVIVSLMEMNDRIIALEELAAEHVAEHEAADLIAQFKEQSRILAAKAEIA
ncbi:hypothetical protein GQH18_002240 [Salmonella enterica]|nr:hypothetical protein [Salmonella enterica]